jgi:hypothetical protein
MKFSLFMDIMKYQLLLTDSPFIFFPSGKEPFLGRAKHIRHDMAITE